MSLYAIKWAYDQRVGKPGPKAVLVALANFANEDGRCWPGQETLAAMTDMDQRTVRRSVDFLESHNFIRREKRHDKQGHRAPDIYELLAAPEDLRPAPRMTRKSNGQPDNLTARPTGQFDRLENESQPDNLTEPTGQFVQSLPDNLSNSPTPPIKAEPSIGTIKEPEREQTCARVHVESTPYHPNGHGHVSAKAPAAIPPAWATEFLLKVCGRWNTRLDEGVAPTPIEVPEFFRAAELVTRYGESYAQPGKFIAFWKSKFFRDGFTGKPNFGSVVKQWADYTNNLDARVER